jgi:hypothetical protein
MGDSLRNRLRGRDNVLRRTGGSALSLQIMSSKMPRSRGSPPSSEGVAVIRRRPYHRMRSSEEAFSARCSPSRSHNFWASSLRLALVRSCSFRPLCIVLLGCSRVAPLLLRGACLDRGLLRVIARLGEGSYAALPLAPLGVASKRQRRAQDSRTARPAPGP